MKIAVNNIDRVLRVELAKHCQIVDVSDKPNGAFIVWTTVDNHSAFLAQTTIITKCLEYEIPLIVFDKNQQMTEDEITYLLKPGVFLWEPALNDRMFFSYQPVWGRIVTSLDDMASVNHNRPVDFGYKGSLSKKVPIFGEYFKPISDVGEFKVAFIDEVACDSVNERVNKMGIPLLDGRTRMADMKMTMLLGTDRQCDKGYLDPQMFTYLENGVIPLLPDQHRWYHGVFDDLTVSRPEDIDYFLKTYEKIAFGCIHDIYLSLDQYLPESNVVNVAERIVNFIR